MKQMLHSVWLPEWTLCFFHFYWTHFFSIYGKKKIPAILTLVNIAYGQSPLDTDGAMEKVCIKRFEFRENIS